MYKTRITSQNTRYRMILLDTNAVSEVMRPHPEPAVIEWLNRADGRSPS
ncbi:hypothetical protein [Halorhodospira halochloris]|nr:hypothetical protein [Halorhodospira halochloris]MCG5549093.1 hypothetical protein [Halorhodospira halochloris]